MDTVDYEFARIPEFDMKELTLLENNVQCGKKRAAGEDIGNGLGRGKKAKMAGPVKIGREAAAKYWQSLIDARRELGVTTEGVKGEATHTPPNHLRSVKLKVRAKTARTDNTALAASVRAKVNLVAQVQSASNTQDFKFKCNYCNKKFAAMTSLGQHTESKHAEQLRTTVSN